MPKVEPQELSITIATPTSHVVNYCFSNKGRSPSLLQSRVPQALIFQSPTFIEANVLPIVRDRVVSLLTDDRYFCPCITRDCHSSSSSSANVLANGDHVASPTIDRDAGAGSRIADDGSRIINDTANVVHPIVASIFILTNIFLLCIFP